MVAREARRRAGGVKRRAGGVMTNLGLDGAIVERRRSVTCHIVVVHLKRDERLL